MTHRNFLRRSAALTALALTLAVPGACALESDGGTTEEGLTTVRVGYLHTVAVDAHMWLGIEDGTFREHGLKVEPVEFDTGLEESLALAGATSTSR